MILESVFWILALLVLHTYFFYPLFLLIASFLVRKDPGVSAYNFYPGVSLVMVAHNKESAIEDKIKNCLELDYPGKSLEIVIVDDCSADSTPDIVSKYRQIKLIRIFEKSGKLNALKTAVPLISSSIVLFSDADVFFNKDIISRIVSHFDDLKVGCVTGYVKLIPKGGSFVSGEGLYSNYEQFIQAKESELSSAIGVNPSLYAVRRELYMPLKNIFMEDFATAINIIKYDYKIVYDPGVSGRKHINNPSIRKEIKRKSKVVAAGFQSIPAMLFSIKKPLFFFQFISHKIVRWLVPEILLAILIINWFLLSQSIYQNLFVLQLLFYLFSPLGVLMSGLRLFSIPYYFFVMNLSAFLGFLRFVTRQKT